MANSKKLLGRANSVKPLQSVIKRDHDGEDAQTNTPSSKIQRDRSLTLYAQSPLFSRLESPIDPALLSQTAKISFHKSHSAISLHTIRPKTAGETVSKRDWKSMMATGSPIEVKTGQDIFSFPTPIIRPSTASSLFPPTKMGGHAAGLNMSQDSGIGMALGSPSDFNYFNSSWGGEAEPQEDVHVFPTPARANTTREVGEGRVQTKLNRWKSIGGLFARKPSMRVASEKGGSSTSRSTASPVIDERSGSEVSNRTRGDSTGSSSNQSESGTPGLWRRATRRKMKPRAWTEPHIRNVGSPVPPPKDSLLEVQIPQVSMERYSVMFQSIQGLPTRSTSLLARRQGGADRLSANHIAELQIHPGALIRRATEPSPASPSYKLFPRSSSETERSVERLPHVSKALRRNPPHLSTIHRPRPIKRTNTSPSAVRSPLSLHTVSIKRQHRLSPALETDELHPPKITSEESDGEGLTPTPSSPASPSTPTFSHYPPVRKNSWETSSVGHENAWEMITIKKRYSPGDEFAASATNLLAAMKSVSSPPPPPPPPSRAPPSAPTPINTKVAVDFSNSPLTSAQTSTLSPLSVDEEDDWICEAPQVVIARSVSVTRANSQRKLMVRPVRSTSRVAKAPILTIASPSSSAPSFQSGAATNASLLLSPSSSTTSLPSTPRGAVVKGDDRLQNKKLDLRREIWGETRAVEQDEKWIEKRSLTPKMCVVEEEVRKSVWGMIETA